MAPVPTTRNSFPMLITMMFFAANVAGYAIPSHVTSCGDGWFSKVSNPYVNAREICQGMGYTGIDQYGGNGGVLCKKVNNRGGNCGWDDERCGQTVDWHCTGYVGNHESACHPNQIEYDGYCYSGMDFLDCPATAAYGSCPKTCQNEFLALPLATRGSGCEVAPFSEDVVRNVVATNDFGTHVMVFADGQGYGGSTYNGGELQSTDRLVSSGNLYKTTGCHYKVLIRCEPRELGFVDYASCEWHEMNQMNKVINSEQFFGYECPPNQIISDLRLEGHASSSVLSNNPTAIFCCELAGHSVVTNTCVDSFSSADGDLEAAVCQGNSAMVGIYDIRDPTIPQNQWQYQATKSITCCDIEYDTDYGMNLDLGIDRNQCEIISHSSPVGSFDVACPEDMVLVEILDNDPAHGVQEVHQIECCKVHNFEAPSKAPTMSPSSSMPSQAPTTACYECLVKVHEDQDNINGEDAFVTEITSCLSLCCTA